MKNMVLGLLCAVLVLVIALLVPSVGPVVAFLERAGCLTIVFWALFEGIRR